MKNTNEQRSHRYGGFNMNQEKEDRYSLERSTNRSNSEINHHHYSQRNGDIIMNGILKKSFKLLSICLLMLILALVGCQKETPFEPPSDNLVMRSSTQLTFLQAKTQRLNKFFSSQQLITAAQGGTMVSGDEVSGFSSLDFLAGAVPQDTTIIFDWDSQGFISDLFPHGIVFNSPVTLKLSYKDADLTGVNEDSLKIWYYHAGTDSWELIGGTVNKTDKYVEVTITHFSRYALASD